MSVSPSGPDDGFRVPPGFGTPPPPPGGGGFGFDPLVPPPAEGLGAVWDRLRDALSRSGKPVLVVLLLTFALPQIGQAVLVATVAGGAVVVRGGGFPVQVEDLAPGEIIALSGGALLLSLFFFVVTTLLTALGWGAAIWAFTHGATGPVTVADALQGGARRMAPMFGWYLVYTLLVTVGTLLCVLPGIYVAVAGCLFSFVVMYEQGHNPLVRSFRLVHSAFGPVLGRVVLLFLFMLAAATLVGGLAGFVVGAAGATGGVPALVLDVVGSLLLVPVYAVLVVGLLLTYTQVRARQEQLSTAALQAATTAYLGEPPGYARP